MVDILKSSLGLIRPCVVTHKIRGADRKQNAIFHRWVSSIISMNDETIVQTLALVEYENGTIGQVKPKNLKFVDSFVREIFDSYYTDNGGDTTNEITND